MKESKVLKAYLVLSGLIALGVGVSVLFATVPFYEDSGIPLGNNISLINELKAMGGGLLAAGALVMSGVFIKRLTYSATLISALMYLAYGLSRVFSMATDGMPVSVLVQVSVVELVVGTAGIYAFLKYQDKAGASQGE